jgi:hypothetical protein
VDATRRRLIIGRNVCSVLAGIGGLGLALAGDDRTIRLLGLAMAALWTGALLLGLVQLRQESRE